MRFLLRPGWIALTLAVAGFAFLCVYLLAPWQFSRSTQRDDANAALAAAIDEAPVPRAELLAPGAEPSPAMRWRQVIVTGTYEPAGEVLVRLRSVDGGAAYEVLTPLRTPSGEAVLVDRGYVRPGSGRDVPPFAPAPPGPVTVVGYQHLDEPGSDRPPIVAGGHRQVYAADSHLVSAATGTALSPGYVQLLGGQPGVLTPVPLPPLDPNSSYSYAWQWLIFGVMAIGAWIYFVRLEYRTRRQQAEQTEQADEAGETGEATEQAGGQAGGPEAGEALPTEPPPPTAPTGRTRTTEEVLADRYGRR